MNLYVLCGEVPSWKKRLHQIANESVVEQIQIIKGKHPDAKKKTTLTALLTEGDVVALKKCITKAKPIVLL